MTSTLAPVTPTTADGPEQPRRTRGWLLGGVPLLVVYVIVFLVPEVVFLSKAFFTTTGPGEVGGPATFATIGETVSADFTIRALVTTLELGAITAVVCVVLGLPLAYASVHWRRWGSPIFIAVVAVMLSSAVARVLGWQVVLGYTGVINKLLLELNLIGQPLPLSDNFFAVCVGQIHAALPLAVIGLIPACTSIRTSVLDASSGLGASQLTTFGRIILPQCRGAVVSIALIVFATTAGSFTTPALLGGGRVPVLSLLIYNEILQKFDYAGAAATALLLLLIVGLVVLAALLADRKPRVVR
ncbi:MAG: hypothetical protein ABS81_04135 [Pseudonocardia sp. SCN 72-86]|nr:MAG: hypothetical protein ABS81_04135 [Pseudonocardia sp. SCN 72-86]